MLHETVGAVSDTARPLEAPRRSIDQILARRHARLRQRTRTFPPDFLHGRAQLDEIYDAFGGRWVEQALFVQRFTHADGELAAWSAAWFDERFLTVEQAVSDEVDHHEQRLEELIEAHRSIVLLSVDQPGQGDGQQPLAVRCSLGRLLELERSLLGVVRDKEQSDPRAVYTRRDEVLLDSRTHLLSLICLCARIEQSTDDAIR